MAFTDPTENYTHNSQFLRNLLEEGYSSPDQLEELFYGYCMLDCRKPGFSFCLARRVITISLESGEIKNWISIVTLIFTLRAKFFRMVWVVGVKLTLILTEFQSDAQRCLDNMSALLPNPNFVHLLREWIWKFAPARERDVLNYSHERFCDALVREMERLENTIPSYARENVSMKRIACK